MMVPDRRSDLIAPLPGARVRVTHEVLDGGKETNSDSVFGGLPTASTR